MVIAAVVLSGSGNGTKIWRDLQPALIDTLNTVRKRLPKARYLIGGEHQARLSSAMSALATELGRDICAEAPGGGGEQAGATPFFYLSWAAEDGGAVGAIEALERSAFELHDSFEILRQRANLRQAALALRLLTNQLRGRALGVRGLLTGAWPPPGLREGQAVVALPRRGAARAAAVAAAVVRVEAGRGRRGERAQLRFRKEEGQWLGWIPRAEWADRVRPAEAPGGDGRGDVRGDDADLAAAREGEVSEDEGGGGAGRRAGAGWGRGEGGGGGAVGVKGRGGAKRQRRA